MKMFFISSKVFVMMLAATIFNLAPSQNVGLFFFDDAAMQLRQRGNNFILILCVIKRSSFNHP